MPGAEGRNLGDTILILYTNRTILIGWNVSFFWQIEWLFKFYQSIINKLTTHWKQVHANHFLVILILNRNRRPCGLFRRIDNTEWNESDAKRRGTSRMQQLHSNSAIASKPELLLELVRTKLRQRKIDSTRHSCYLFHFILFCFESTSSKKCNMCVESMGRREKCSCTPYNVRTSNVRRTRRERKRQKASRFDLLELRCFTWEEKSRQCNCMDDAGAYSLRRTTTHLRMLAPAPIEPIVT